MKIVTHLQHTMVNLFVVMNKPSKVYEALASEQVNIVDSIFCGVNFMLQ